eukprot:9084130-Heterocapsa_arctica.AAC.1
MALSDSGARGCRTGGADLVAPAGGDLMPPFRASVGVPPSRGQPYRPVGPLASRDHLIPSGIPKDP